MNDGRLFINGELRYQSLRKSRDVSSFTVSRGVLAGQTVLIPSNTTFISHQSGDARAAERVATRLSIQGYPCYLDTLDPNLDGESEDLESYLRGIIGQCSSLMAMVSRTTKTSWWVPLEIGVALEKEKHIGTYLLDQENLPSYLWQWPMLWTDEDAVNWAQDTRRSSAAAINRSWRLRTRLQKQTY